MKCLSIKQPWASLIASGHKTVELRSWRRDYRGPLIVCAGARPETRWGAAEYDTGPVGVVVCCARLVDIVSLTPALFADSCVKADFADFDDWFAWMLEDVTPLSPVPVSGQLGLWTPTAVLLKQLELAA